MAYVFFSPNKQGVISIAANDADKSQIAGHYLSGSFVEETISIYFCDVDKYESKVAQYPLTSATSKSSKKPLIPV